MSVCNQLAGACTAVGQTHAVNQVVQTALQKEHEVFTVDTLDLSGLVEQVAELLFVQAVHLTQLLLFLQLNAIAAQFLLLARAMYSGRKRALCQFFACAGQGNAQTAAQFKFRTCVTCHVSTYSFNF
ncbi:hypothetical protein D3C75_970760 [compost metagenome]